MADSLESTSYFSMNSLAAKNFIHFNPHYKRLNNQIVPSLVLSISLESILGPCIKVKIMPDCELMPTAVTTILPLPSITCVPANIIGSSSSVFSTYSVSPVNDDSSTYTTQDVSEYQSTFDY